MLKLLITTIIVGVIMSGCSATLRHPSTTNPNNPSAPPSSIVSTQVGPSVNVGGGGGAGLGLGIGF
ncbi:MAG TPA: hypothetical protein VHE99_10600 [Gammaproteobacteria bacterium]|nr:hypothetical protein [Gammaproteobacteria bacterium]